MMPPPECYLRKCKWYSGIDEVGGEGEQYQVPVCAAFPNGIPDKIAYGNNKHLKPVKGDNGIQYEKA